MNSTLDSAMIAAAPADYSRTFIIEQYFPSLASEKESALNYLHQANNWQLTISIGGLVAAVVQDEFPNFTSLAIACLVFVATCHMFSRAAKAYTNLIRYSTIERAILRWIAFGSQETERAAVSASIFSYHVKWRSPLSLTAVCTKVLFELGFSFQLIACLIAISYCAVADPEPIDLYAIGVAAVLGIAELTLGLFRSPYFDQPMPNATADRLK